MITTASHKAIQSQIHRIYCMQLPYDTKFWREKILANLGSCKRFTKTFLSKIFLPKVPIQIATMFHPSRYSTLWFHIRLKCDQPITKYPQLYSSCSKRFILTTRYGSTLSFHLTCNSQRIIIILGALEILGIRQNIIRQFLVCIVSPKISPSKILCCTVCIFRIGAQYMQYSYQLQAVSYVYYCL